MMQIRLTFPLKWLDVIGDGAGGLAARPLLCPVDLWLGNLVRAGRIQREIISPLSRSPYEARGRPPPPPPIRLGGHLYARLVGDGSRRNKRYLSQN